MKKILLALIVLLLNYTSYTQCSSLVQNGGFDINNSCGIIGMHLTPYNPPTTPPTGSIANWNSLFGSPDIMVYGCGSNSVSNEFDINAPLPDKPRGNTGAFATYDGSSSVLGLQCSSSENEAVQQVLSSPLVPGHYYQIRFRAKLGNDNPTFTDGSPARVIFGSSTSSTLYSHVAGGTLDPAAPTYTSGISNLGEIAVNSTSWQQYRFTFLWPSSASSQQTFIFGVCSRAGYTDNNFTYFDGMEIFEAPFITVTGSTTFCNGGSVLLTSSASSGNNWFLNGVSISGATGTTYTATVSGIYTVEAGPSNPCKASSLPVTVTVLTPPPTPTISPSGSVSFCAGGSITLTSSASSGNQWNQNGSAISGATSVTYNATSAGSYTVTVTGSNGCTATSVATVVSVKPKLDPPTVSSPVNICAGSPSVSLEPSSGNYHWYTTATGGVPLSSTPFTSSTASAGTTVSYWVSAFDPSNNSCESNRVEIVINYIPCCNESCYWTLHGNTVNNGCDDEYIGTNNEADLRLRTSVSAGSTNMLRLTSSGNLSLEPNCNSNNFNGSTSLAVGLSNTVNNYNNTAIGSGNTIGGGDNNLVSGAQNFLNPETDNYYNFVAGINNRLSNGTSSMIMGSRLWSTTYNTYHFGASGSRMSPLVNSVSSSFMIGWTNDRSITDDLSGHLRHTFLANNEGVAIKTTDPGHPEEPRYNITDPNMDMATARLDVQADGYKITSEAGNANRPSGVRFRRLPQGSGNILVIDDNGYIFKSDNRAKTASTDAKVDEMQKEIDELKAQVKALLESRNYSPCTVVKPSNSTLEIVPTPFADNAKAIYSIDNFSGEATLQVADMNGKVLKTFAINQAKGQIEIGSIASATATIIFNVVSDGKVLVTKKSIKIAN